jgi:hypothetical protein
MPLSAAAWLLRELDTKLDLGHGLIFQGNYTYLDPLKRRWLNHLSLWCGFRNVALNRFPALSLIKIYVPTGSRNGLKTLPPSPWSARLAL